MYMGLRAKKGVLGGPKKSLKKFKKYPQEGCNSFFWCYLPPLSRLECRFGGIEKKILLSMV
jgi:hypothetical protein